MGIWNQFGSVGSIQSIWDVKEQIVAYLANGSHVATVTPPSQPYGSSDKKEWVGALRMRVEAVIVDLGTPPTTTTTMTTTTPGPNTTTIESSGADPSGSTNAGPGSNPSSPSGSSTAK